MAPTAARLLNKNYTLEAARHANCDFDTATWVVWVNSQFATVFFSFFLVVNRV